MTRIKELRIAKGVTQEELGKVLNVQKAAISKYENGRVEPSIEVLKLASKFFDVSTDYLLGRSDSPINIKSVGVLIRDRRIELRITQKEVADFVGVSEATVSRWESGHIDNMRRDRIAALSKILRLSPLDIMGIGNNDLSFSPPPASPSKEKTIRIPILGRVAAGNPIGAIEEIIGWEEIPKKLAAGSTCFALRVCGRSMEPRILAGDIVIIRQQPDVDSGDIAVVLVGGEEATVKRVKKQKDGIILVATNTTVYEPHFYSNQEIKNLPIQILGKVVEVRYKP